ncbi:MAG: hypothetical protein AAF849_21340 [Bacteroidota bacterium]
MLINGVQEQQAMIEAPDEQLEGFEADLKQLERELQALKASLISLQKVSMEKD